MTFYRQAVDIYVSLQDLSKEGLIRSNLAFVLVKLQRYAGARVELQRVIECRQSFGHAAQLWVTWDILYELEVAVGNTQAAMAARHQASKLCTMPTYCAPTSDQQNNQFRRPSAMARISRSR